MSSHHHRSSLFLLLPSSFYTRWIHAWHYQHIQNPDLDSNHSLLLGEFPGCWARVACSWNQHSERCLLLGICPSHHKWGTLFCTEHFEMSCVSPTPDNNHPSITVVTSSELTLPYPQLFHGRPPITRPSWTTKLNCWGVLWHTRFSYIVWINMQNSSD